MVPEKPKTRKSKTSSAKLERTTFRTSREMDFFSEKELVTQTGHGVDEWPLVIVKELVDNCLDACEEADISPIVEIVADASGISVKDNGPGLPESTLQGQLDFTIRTSNREAYVSPCRGAQGNALKTLLPMPNVLDPDGGRFIVEAHDKRYVFKCGADPISQRPVVHPEVSELGKSKKLRSANGPQSKLNPGTLIRLEWTSRADDDGDIIWPFDGLLPLWRPSFADQFRALVEGFAIFNPHATIKLDWFGTQTTWEATDPSWSKWKPCQPTSAHWYELQHLQRLIAAYITHDQDRKEDRLVRDFIGEFDCLTGSAKRSRVLEDAGLHRVRLSAFVVDGQLDVDRITQLLCAMQNHSKPVKPGRLGVIGEEHFRTRLLAMGVQPESFRYSRVTSDQKSKKRDESTDAEKLNPLPWVLESAFGWKGEKSKDRRDIFTGANWSAAIKNPFRSFGSTGEGLETVLSEMRATSNEPVVFVLHLAHPRIEYTDRGKSSLIIGRNANDD